MIDDLKISEFNYLGFNLKGKTVGEIHTTCIFCSGERKKKNQQCVSIKLPEGLYHCHHCGKAGSIHKWVRLNTKKDYKRPEKIKSLGSIYSKELLEYFKKRGISEATLKKAKVTETKEYMPQTKKEEHVICFNYFRDNILINTKYRTF